MANIYIALKDEMSRSLNTIRGNVRSLSKESEELNAQVKKLNGTKAKLQTNAVEAAEQLKAAKKAFREAGEEQKQTARETLEAEQEKYNGIQSAIKKLNAEERELYKTTKDIKAELEIEEQKSIGGKLTDVAQALNIGGVFQEFGNAVGALAGAQLGSATTDAQANAISSTLSGAITGAMAGSAAGPIGALAGAIVGGLAGGITAAAQEFENKDDYFKNIVQQEVEGSLQSIKDSVTSGSETAKQLQVKEKVFIGYLMERKYIYRDRRGEAHALCGEEQRPV